MKKLILILSLITVVVTFAAGATKPQYPRPVYGTLLSPVETEKLLDAAVRHSPYSKPWFKRPVVDLVPTPVWQGQVCGDAAYDCGILGYTSSEERDIVHIVAVIPADAVKALGWTRDEIIVHELTHWLQMNAKPDLFDDQGCAVTDAIETEAYNVQFQYAVEDLKLDQGFWKPDIYAECILAKLAGRGSH